MAQTVVIVDYESGNLHSAHKAVERAARDHGCSSPDLRRRQRHRGPPRPCPQLQHMPRLFIGGQFIETSKFLRVE